MALIGDYIGHFEPGYLTVVGGGLPHDWVTATGPGEVIDKRDIVLQFDPQRIRRAAASIPEFARLEPFMTRALRGLSFLGETREAAAGLLEQMGAAAGLERVSLFLRLLHVLATSSEFEILSSESFAPDLDPPTLDKIQRALIYVLENFHKDIKLSEIAGLSGMRQSRFSRFFKKNSGNSFIGHVTKLRIGRACKLLSDTDIPVTDICFQVGYFNISNFNRVFRAQRGMTPSAYRRLARRRMG
ncbi:AraC family transcriptional regulator [Lichenihabitans sp. PAMC28606]|uniref:helix-turn-helix transcriptional regulator n=1 Tax=Lichenihabitans sp. PAMC28606 TaxID=2880932 RepID=UPI001D09F2F1|nr:AraC family transcriptional regulator [Lichenihabitans sp. PAMC28606]UDL96273.1 AraC family transcriptional regulator [Lichenihabitans sp. PAMC28606]